MLRFGQRVGDVDAAGVAAAGVREHADYVRPGHCGVFGSLLEHEDEPGAAPGHGAGERAPARVAGERALRHDQRYRLGVERRAATERQP